MLYRHNKKEQDQLPAHTYEEAQKGKKKSSVLIQLSGWLRTLDMANDSNFDRNPLRGCNYGLEGGAFLILGGAFSMLGGAV